MRRMLPTDKQSLIKTVVELANTPYLWGGKGDVVWSPSGLKPSPYFGLDCSGLYTFALKQCGGPDWRLSHNTDKLWNDLRSTDPEDLEPGDLAFYGGQREDDVSHVEVVLTILRDGTVVNIGAAGGGRQTLSVTAAKRTDARVKVRPGHRLGRSDFRGFRKGVV